MPRVVHVLLGDSAAGSFKQSEIATDRNDVLTLYDHLSCGPLSPISDVQSWTRGRMAYWRSIIDSWEPADEGLYADPLGLQASDEIVLWQGTELGDQIALAWLPAFLRALDAQSPQLKVVQFERSPRGVEVLSLAILHPKDIAAHPPPISLTSDDIAELHGIWNALTAPEPVELIAYARSSSGRFPLLLRALRECLTRYPDGASGVNAWEAR